MGSKSKCLGSGDLYPVHILGSIVVIIGPAGIDDIISITNGLPRVAKISGQQD
jgi:hypothetical protein